MANGIKAIAIATVVLFAAFASGLPVLFHLAYVLVAIIVLCGFWAWSNAHWMQVKREVRTLRTQVGGVAEERFLVRNTSFIPKLWVEIKDLSTLPNHRVSQVFILPPRGSKLFTVSTICRRRGKYALGPCSVTTGDPFGIFRRSKLVEEKHTLLVYPATVDLPNFEIPVGELPGGYALRQRTHQVTPMASGVREYVPGDSLNRIHWLTSAKTGHLMTKEFELDPASDIWIVLDMEQRVQAGVDEDSTEEYAITVAASLAKHFLSQNRSVGVVACGASYEVVHSDRGTRQLLKILERLAIIRAEGRVPLAEIIAAEGVRFGCNTTVVAISPSVDESWARALNALKQHGVRTVAVVLEASTFGRQPWDAYSSSSESRQGNAMLVVGELATADTPTYLVKRGDILENVLIATGSR